MTASTNSLTHDMKATVDLSYLNIPETCSNNWGTSSQESKQLESTLQQRLSKVREYIYTQQFILTLYNNNLWFCF